MYINRPRMNPKRPFWHYLDRSMDDHRNNWHTSGNGEDEGTFLEWTQRIGVPARSLREDDDRASATDFFSGDVVGPKCCLPVVALDLDHADGAHAPAKDRHLKQLGLRHELVPRENLSQRRNVEPADVVRSENGRLAQPELLGAVHAQLDAGRPEYQRRPPARRLLEEPVGLVVHPQHRRDDNS